MRELGSWTCLTVAAVALAWIVIVGTIAAWPLIQAIRLMKAAEEQHGIAAVSASIMDLVWRVAVVCIPPLILLAFWLIRRVRPSL